jgi:beta-glucosidase-like glycosyl hydrolase
MAWDTELVSAMYEKIAEATRAGGANIAFAPVINMFMDPRWDDLKATWTGKVSAPYPPCNLQP